MSFGPLARLGGMTPQTGYVPVGDLQVYYEIHGEGGTPLLLLHGGLFDIEEQFGALLPALSAGRRVVGIDLQGHGHTNDIDRPLNVANLAADAVAALDHLGLAQVDVFGFSLGGAVAVELAVSHPERVRKLIASSISISRDGERGQNTQAVSEMTVDMLAGSPMERLYMDKSPHPDREHLQALLDKIGVFMKEATGWSDEQIRGIQAPTLITVGDCDMVTLEHAVKFLRLRGGDVNGDFDGVPASQLAVFPGTTHFFGLARTDLVLGAVIPFLDADAPR
jgi:pimeloyl-ACP methyl ester carboxylesterase